MRRVQLAVDLYGPMAEPRATYLDHLLTSFSNANARLTYHVHRINKINEENKENPELAKAKVNEVVESSARGSKSFIAQVNQFARYQK